jgi:hypothetical protein
MTTKRYSVDYIRESNYQEEYMLYNSNLESKLEDWLLFNSVFSRLGENGVVGILESKESQLKFIFKFSKYKNYLSIHEHMIYQSLTCIESFCPHFSRSYGIISSKTNKNYKAENPFHIEEFSYGVTSDILLLEHYENKPKFNQYLLNPNVSETIIFATVKQVLLGLCFAQKKIQFTHYDLHSSNIFMDRCSPNIVFLYVVDEHNQFYIAPKGHFPIIFDFGFSYTNDIENNNMRCTLAHSNTGHTSNTFDWVADAKNFLVSVSSTLTKTRESKKIKKFRNVVKNIFSPLKISLDNGWDKGNGKSASDILVDTFRNLNKVKSELFRTRTYECIDIIQSLIILPFDKQDYNDIKLNYYSFLTEWVKIEKEFISKVYMLSILKDIVDSANSLRCSYFDDETRHGSIEFFKEAVYESIEKVSKFCRPKNINFELMLGSILLLSNDIEGIFFTISNESREKKNKMYDRLMFSSIEQIFASIEVLFQDDFVFKNNTEILIFDSVREKTEQFKLSSNQTDCINQLSNLVKGTYIYDLYKSSIEIHI